MGIIAIANISNGKLTIGLRLLDTDTRQIKDVPMYDIINTLRTTKLQIDNIELQDNKIIGSNGSIDRLPKIINGQLIGKSPLIIINQVGALGYTVTDYKGEVLRMLTNGVVDYAKENGIANGEVVGKNNRGYIRPIKGEYKKLEHAYPTEKLLLKINTLYDDWRVHGSGVIRVYSNGRQGLISPAGKVIAAPKYNDTWVTVDGIYVVSDGITVSMMDAAGNVISEGYEYIFQCGEGLYKVQKDGKWGCLDAQGKEVVPCIFERIDNFSEGLVQIKINGRYGYMDKTGRIVINTQFHNAGQFSEGYAKTMYKDTWNFIDKSGQIVIKTEYTQVGDFSEGLAPVRSMGLWGFIDKTGRLAIPTNYREVHGFSEGFSRITLENSRDTYIDRYGNRIFRQYDQGMSFSEGLAAVSISGKWGFIDKTDKVVIPIQYESVHQSMILYFREGLIPVKKNGLVGYIDTRGNVAIPFQFNAATNFYGGIAEASYNGKHYFCIDKTGKPIYE